MHFSIFEGRFDMFCVTHCWTPRVAGKEAMLKMQGVQGDVFGSVSYTEKLGAQLCWRVHVVLRLAWATGHSYCVTVLWTFWLWIWIHHLWNRSQGNCSYQGGNQECFRILSIWYLNICIIWHIRLYQNYSVSTMSFFNLIEVGWTCLHYFDITLTMVISSNLHADFPKNSRRCLHHPHWTAAVVSKL